MIILIWGGSGIKSDIAPVWTIVIVVSKNCTIFLARLEI